MESNFIKERVVVRENIIKKNLEQEKARGKESLPSNVFENPSKKTLLFEELVNERLKQDLVDLSQQVDSVCQIIADYLKIKSTLKIFRRNPKDLRVQTNIGCNFYAQCHIDDASRIYLCVGKDYFLHMELDEAIKMIDFKENQLTKQLDLLQEKASKIKAYIKIALETMDRLYKSETR